LQLTEGSRLTRQAVTKHLRVLESAGIVHSVRSERESLFEFQPEPIADIREYLEFVSRQRDEAPAEGVRRRLKGRFAGTIADRIRPSIHVVAN
jgi:DNA-binding transcriptional ArsR family regulator